jgi:hypothetical protein
MIKKHIKPISTLSDEERKQGSIIHIESPIHISKISLIDPLTGAPTTVKWQKVNEKWVRISKSSNSIVPIPGLEPRKRVMGPFDTDSETTNRTTFSPSLGIYPIPEKCDHI